MELTEVTEMCPHCQNEVTVQWNVEKDGYELYCPYCGFPIMLCSMCDERDGKVCDWEEIKGCKHSDERYRDYFYKNLSRENTSEITRSPRDNDSWIPVDERLPEDDGFYIATMDGEIVGQEEPFVGLAELENGLWVDDDIDYRCIIAWQSLPEPYSPERRSDEKE